MSVSKEYTFTASRKIDGVVYCDCPGACPRRLGAQRHRYFYACSREREDPDRCKFFRWADELDEEESPSPTGTVASRPITPPNRSPNPSVYQFNTGPRNMLPTTPQTPRRQLAQTPAEKQDSIRRRREAIERSLRGDDVTPLNSRSRAEDKMEVDPDSAGDLGGISSSSTVRPPTTDKGKGRATVGDENGSPTKKFRPASSATKVRQSSASQKTRSGTPGRYTHEDDPDDPFHGRAAKIKATLPAALPVSTVVPSKLPALALDLGLNLTQEPALTIPAIPVKIVTQPDPLPGSSGVGALAATSHALTNPDPIPDQNLGTDSGANVIASLEAAVQYIRDLQRQISTAERSYTATIRELEDENKELKTKLQQLEGDIAQAITDDLSP